MNVIKELWHGNIVPQDDSRNNSPEMKELMEYMARHHDDLLKSMTDGQKEIFEKFDDWSEYMSLAEAAIFEYAFRLGASLPWRYSRIQPNNESGIGEISDAVLFCTYKGK